MLPRFLIPSVVWYGLEPLLDRVRLQPGAPDLSLGGWGGLLRGDDDIEGALATLDPVLLLLNLAGYQVPEVAIGVPASARETPAIELIAVDMRTMFYAKGTGHPYAPPGTTPPSASVALWLEPRYPAAHPAVADGPTLALAGMADALADEPIALEFASLGIGWLRLSWPAGAELPGWPSELARVVDVLSDALAGELEGQYFAAGAAAESNGGGTPLCGLLSVYDSRTWTEPVPPDPVLDDLTPLVSQFGDDLSTLLNGGADVAGIGLGEFLRAEIAPPPDGPLSTLDRWSLGAGADSRTIVESLSLCADELVDQSFAVFDDEDAAAEFAATAFRDLDTLPVTTLLMRWQELGVLDFLESIEKAVDVLFAGDVYGGYDLQRDDSDATLVYGGKQRSAAAGDVVPLPVEAGYVAQLRRDLAELGFGPLVGHTSDEAPVQAFDLWLERAVREFQLYAKMPKLAEETTDVGTFLFYGERLNQVVNPQPYGGPVCAVANAETRALIQEWRRRRLRCPVVIEARRKDAQKHFTVPYLVEGVTTDNLWRAEQVPSANPRMYARDFTGHWTLSAASVAKARDLEGGFVLGAWTGSDFGTGPWADAPTHTWAEAEILPESLTGSSFAALTEQARSSFRVIRTVAEVECLAYFDCFNAYDPGFISAGPYHWTIGLALAGSTQTDDAELPPYFAYLKGLGGDEAAAFEAAFGIFGCGVTKSWPRGTSGPTSPCFEPSHRKYTAWITLEDEDGVLVEGRRAANETAEWFRQWHWFFRFAMTARTNEGFRQGMWDYARLRLRDVLDTPWFPEIVKADGEPATIGDLFTSERAAATILRWHVNAPANLLPLDPARRPKKDKTSRLTTAFQNAGAAAWGDPSAWTDANEEAICDALFAASADANAWLRQSLEQVYGWPTWTANNTRAWALDVASVLPARSSRDWRTPRRPSAPSTPRRSRSTGAARPTDRSSRARTTTRSSRTLALRSPARRRTARSR